MNTFALLAEAFRYPHPGLRETLERESAALPAGPVRAAMMRFLQALEPLSLAAWEELYTRTFDLNPLTAPYLGFHRWGESYARGDFMAKLNARYRALDVPTEGELPDHVIPVFRYLALAEEPLPELLEVLPIGLRAMHKALQKADGDNPYLALLEAARHAVEALARQPAGG